MRKGNYFTPLELKMFSEQLSMFNEAQMKIINRKTPDSEVEIKTDKSGFKYKSVKAAYVKALVTMVTGGNYDFEIKSREYLPATKEVLVEARLTINSNEREQFGQHYLQLKTDVTGKTTTTYPSEVGNGFKAAASDAFKKCASEFGFCWDIYGQEHADTKKTEQPDLDHADKKKLERLEHFLTACKQASDIELTYDKFLETSEETDGSKSLLKKHMSRVLKNKE